MNVAADCLLSLHGIDPDTASDYARAGAIRQVEHQRRLDDMARIVAAIFTKK